jgi:hypothetical protein
MGRAQRLVPLVGGANNRVFRVEAEDGRAVLKSYFRHPDDPRDRLGADWAFSNFAWSVGVRRIPRPLQCDPGAGYALYGMVDGISPSQFASPLLVAAGEFVRDLNDARWKPLASRLPIASEACFSLGEHLGTVAARVARLGGITDRQCGEFVRDEVLPAWDRVRATVGDSSLSPGRVLTPPERCVSPSDFGFHNALVDSSGQVYFLDFEYAGWDDPAKLICDFFCQPAVPVPVAEFERFAGGVAHGFPDSAGVVARARLLLPVYRLKWVCIRLNEFLPSGRRRREFSLPGERPEDRGARQLAAARAALHDLQEAPA